MNRRLKSAHNMRPFRLQSPPKQSKFNPETNSTQKVATTHFTHNSQTSYNINQSPQQQTINENYQMKSNEEDIFDFNDEEQFCIDANQIVKLYQAKCQDILLDVKLPQLFKFIDRIRKNCINSNLDLSDQQLGINSAKIIAQILLSNGTFSRLNLAKNHIKDEGAIIISQILPQVPQIAILNVSNNNISPKGCQIIFDAIKNSQNIFSLDISSPDSYNRNRLNLSSARSLRKMLSENQILQFLNLQNVALGPQGLYCIVQGLFQNRSLVYLNISQNDLGQECGRILQQYLSNTKLIELDVSGNNIGDISIEKMGEGMKSIYCCIERLNFSQNGINSLGLCNFFNSIQGNSYCKKLDFEGNKFTDAPLDHLMTFFANNLTLEMVSFKNCIIQLPFLNKLADGISVNNVLMSLNLSQNFIGDEGIKYLCSSFIQFKNQTLEELFVCKCNIQEEGGVELAKLLKQHPKLVRLSASNNLMGEQSGNSFIEALRSNISVQLLNVQSNFIRYDQQLEIQNLLNENKEYLKQKKPERLLGELQCIKSNDVKKETLFTRNEQLCIKQNQVNQELEKITKEIQQTQQECESKNAELLEQLDYRKKLIKEIYTQMIDQEKSFAINLDEIESLIRLESEKITKIKKEIENLKKEKSEKYNQIENKKNYEYKTFISNLQNKLKAEIQKVKNDEMAYDMFQSNVDKIKANIALLQKGVLPNENQEEIDKALNDTQEQAQKSPRKNPEKKKNKNNNNNKSPKKKK